MPILFLIRIEAGIKYRVALQQFNPIRHSAARAMLHSKATPPTELFLELILLEGSSFSDIHGRGFALLSSSHVSAKIQYRLPSKLSIKLLIPRPITGPSCVLRIS